MTLPLSLHLAILILLAVFGTYANADDFYQYKEIAVYDEVDAGNDFTPDAAIADEISFMSEAMLPQEGTPEPGSAYDPSMSEMFNKVKPSKYAKKGKKGKKLAKKRARNKRF